MDKEQFEYRDRGGGESPPSLSSYDGLVQRPPASIRPRVGNVVGTFDENLCTGKSGANACRITWINSGDGADFAPRISCSFFVSLLAALALFRRQLVIRLGEPFREVGAVLFILVRTYFAGQDNSG